MGCAGLPMGAVTFQYTENSADTTTGLNIGTAVVGKSFYITDMVISSDTEMVINLTESDNDPIMDDMYFPKQAIWSKVWGTPITLHPSTYLVLTGSAVGNVTITITGYIK